MEGRIVVPDAGVMLSSRWSAAAVPRTQTGPKGEAPGSARERLAGACEEFEAIFIEQMLKAMRRTVGSSESRQEAIYRSLFDEEVSRVLAKRGLGLKELLLGHLDQKASAKGEGLEAQVSVVPADKEPGAGELTEILETVQEAGVNP